MERYSIFNNDPGSYTWRWNGQDVDMDKTMEENGIPDERDALGDLGLPPHLYIPGIFLYYNDDFKHYECGDDDSCDSLVCEDIDDHLMTCGPPVDAQKGE